MLKIVDFSTSLHYNSFRKYALVGGTKMVFSFSKGDIVFHYYKTGNKSVIDGPHKSVVLHSDTVENSTITICPISSVIDSHGNQKKLKPWHLLLKKEDYPCLDHDSYVKLDQIITVDRQKVSEIKVPTSLIPIDMISLDLKIISFYEMAKTMQKVLNKEKTKEIENLIKEIDDDLKEHVRDGIKDLLKGVNKKVQTLVKEQGIENKEELIKTMIKIDVDIISKVSSIIDEVLTGTKLRYVEKYKCK